MAKITVKIRNGKVTTEAEGYKGNACLLPLNNLMAMLGGNIDNETVTAEGALPDEPIYNEQAEEVRA